MVEILEADKFLHIPEDNQKIIEEAVFNVFTSFEKDFPDILPDAILLPDTGARVLSHLIKPVIRAIARRRNVVEPAIVFVKIMRKDPNKYDSFNKFSLHKIMDDYLNEGIYELEGCVEDEEIAQDNDINVFLTSLKDQLAKLQSVDSDFPNALTQVESSRIEEIVSRTKK